MKALASLLIAWALSWAPALAEAKAGLAFVMKSHFVGEVNSLTAIANALDMETRHLFPDELPLQDEIPDLILHALGAVEDVEAVARFKALHPRVRLINFGDPLQRRESFDLIVQGNHLPRVEALEQARNYVRVSGVPSQITESALAAATGLWRSRLSGAGRSQAPTVTVLVGGTTARSAMNRRHADLLVANLERLRAADPMRFIVITSRRTPPDVTERLRLAFGNQSDDHFFDWERASRASGNPYVGAVGLADFLVVTGDSMSMIADGLRTGKPVYVFAPEGSLEDRHKAFILEQARRGRVRPLSTRLESFSYTRLDTAAEVASIIRARFFSGRLPPVACSQFFALPNR